MSSFIYFGSAGGGGDDADETTRRVSGIGGGGPYPRRNHRNRFYASHFVSFFFPAAVASPSAKYEDCDGEHSVRRIHRTKKRANDPPEMTCGHNGIASGAMKTRFRFVANHYLCRLHLGPKRRSSTVFIYAVIWCRQQTARKIGRAPV